MRNIEERVWAVKLRIKAIEDQKKIRRRRILCVGSFAACLLFLVGLSSIMPGILYSMADDKYDNFGTTASIFNGSSFLGFVLIGFLAFVLGISVTILAYKIKQLNQSEQNDREEKENMVSEEWEND